MASQPRGPVARTLATRLLPPLLVAVAALAVAWPILDNYFYADDFLNLIEFANHGLRDALATPAAGHMCIVRNAVFYYTFRWFGMQPAAYFATALATHVVNVLLLFTLIRRITASASLAFLGGALFAAAPANMGTLGWYSVYGHALGATFTLAAILLVVPASDAPSGLGTRPAVGAACCMLLASQCFGTAAAVAVIFPFLVLLLRPDGFRNTSSAVVLLAVPALVAVAWLVMNGYPTRLNPAGTAGLEGLVRLAGDWRNVSWMTAHLFALGLAGLLLGPTYPLSRYPDVLSAGILLTFVGATGMSLHARGPRTRALVAFLAAALACYVAIAAGRASLYAAFNPKSLLAAFADSTRYQYLGQVWLAVVLCIVLADVVRRLPEERYGTLLLCGWGTWAALSGVLLRPPVNHFAANRARVTGAWQRIVEQVRAAPQGTTVCLGVEPVPMPLGFPASLGIFMLFSPTDELEGRRVRFVSSDPHLLARRDAGGRLQRLLLPVDECS